MINNINSNGIKVGMDVANLIHTVSFLQHRDSKIIKFTSKISPRVPRWSHTSTRLHRIKFRDSSKDRIKMLTLRPR